MPDELLTAAETHRAEAFKAATTFIDRCIAISVEYGGRPPGPTVRALAIAEVAGVTEGWMKLAERIHA